MNWRQLWNAGKQLITRGIQQIETKMKEWTTPAPDRQITGVANDLVRSKPELIAENAFLRQQVIVLKRQNTGRPSITQHDRRVLVMLASKLRGWKDALHLVKPDTLTKWHRQGFRLYWRRKSQGQPRKPRISPEAIALIKEMAVKNRLWGSPRIRDELLKLGFKVAKRTVQKYMRQARRGLPLDRKGQTWATFLANHADEIWACDFVQTYDVFFRTIFVFVIIELESRRVVHVNVTRRPTDAWVAQQLREATPFGEGPRFLIRDNDKKFGDQFQQVINGTHIELLKTPVEAPRANAFCERFLGSVRRECLDYMLILSERHLRRVVTEYVTYFNEARPHQGIDQRIPCGSPLPDHPDGKIVGVPVLGGLHHNYRRKAA